MKREDSEIDKRFLYRENENMRVQLKQMQSMNKFHKDAIYQLSQPHMNQKNVISILLDLLWGQKNCTRVQSLKEDILKLQNHQMILEKIVEQIEEEEKQNYHILKQDFNQLQEVNQRLEKKVHGFYEKIGEVDYLSGLVTKYREIVPLNEQAALFKKQQDQLLEFISMQKEQIDQLTQEKNKLLKINLHMKEQVEKHKEDVRNMSVFINSPDLLLNTTNPDNNILDELDEPAPLNGTSFLNTSLNNSKNVNNLSTTRNLNTTLNNFINMQRKVIKQEAQDGASEDEMEDYPELNVLFPDKVEKIQKEKKDKKVPYLNMVKIRELMTKREQKIRKQIQQDNKRINPTDKIIKLESELAITRKEHTNQTLKFKNMEQQLNKSQTLCEELQARLHLLTDANERLTVNSRNISKEFHFNKIIVHRLEKALGKSLNPNSKFDQFDQVEITERVKKVEQLIEHVFGSRGTPQRSRSTDEKKLKRMLKC